MGHRSNHAGEAARGANPPSGAVFGELTLAAQRRQLTVMFCDLVGSTELAARLDPEDMDEVTRAYHRCCAASIEAAGGFIAKYMGDGVLAYFGYPRANEDDAERAVQAGLMLADAVPRLRAPTGLPLAVRVGVATGLVVVGDLIGSGASEERSVAGATPNLAARLQGIAPHNGVVVSDTTRRLAAGVFDFRRIGDVALKGFDAGETAWCVEGARPAAARFRARHDREPAPLVGRDGELALILDRWSRTAAGEGQIVGLSGEPGIGKSRLIYEARKAIGRQPHIWLEGGGAQVFRNTPYYTISQLVRRGLGGDRPLSAAKQLAALQQALSRARVRNQDALPLIAELVGVPTPDSEAPLTLSADQRQAGVIAALWEWLLNSAAKQPVVVVVEDLHWVDPSSMELLDALADKVPASRILFLYSTRDEACAPWRLGPRHVHAALPGLDEESLRSLVAATSGSTLAAPVLGSLVSRAGGVPLFAEELTRLILDQPDVALAREIPDTLSDLLMARLDRLGAAKEVAQIASVLGAEFTFDLLRAVSGLSAEELGPALEALTAADLLIRRGPVDRGGFAFRHALIQDSAYQALLKRQRRTLHRRAATILTEDFPHLVSAQPEVLAEHWTQAGEPELAVAAWQEAGRSASARRAYQEAEHAYGQAIALVADLPESDRRDQRELQLQSARLPLLQFLRGYAAGETVDASRRARVLAERGGDLQHRARQLVSVWSGASSGGDYEQAGKLAAQLHQLAQAEGSPGLLGAAFMIQMTQRYRTGDVLGAEETFGAGRPYFAAPGYHRHPGAAAHTFGSAALIAWMLDNPAEARRRCDRVLTMSKASGNPFDLAFGEYVAAEISIALGLLPQAVAHADAALFISQEHKFPGFADMGRVMKGRALAGLGKASEGVALLRAGLAGRGQSFAQMTMYLTWLGEAEILGGDEAAARAALEQALGANPMESYYRPETLRLRAELRRREGDFAGAEADLRAAVSASKTSGTRLFHNRASVELTALTESVDASAH